MNTPEYSSLSPDKLVAMLATLGLYLASESTMYRLLRRKKLLAARGRAKSRRHYRPKELRATGPKQVWAWDITFLPTTVRGRFLKLYLVLDIWSRYIVGAAVHEVEDDALAAQLLESCYKEQLIEPSTLALHSDNGSAMKGSTMLAKLQQLGVMPSFSRPRVSDDNPYPEALNRTLKYHPGYPQKPFASLDEAQQWVAAFVRWYNTEHLHSGISFVTPEQRHNGQDQAILTHRRKVYAAAKARRPDRWTGRVRRWQWTSEVVLNPANDRGKKNA
jgi:putative transposase